MTDEVVSHGASPGLPTIWIVDDSPLEAELVRRALAPLYHVDVFTDGAAVIEQFASEPSPDAVVLDWQMPGISGIDVCQFLRGRRETQSIPILMLTVQRETRDLVQCLAAGADDFLAKPCNAAELSARVGALVRSKRLHERAQTAERAVRSLLMQLPEGLMSIDAAGRVAFVNGEAQRMLGSDAADVIGKPLRDVLPGIGLDGLSAHPAEPVILPDVVVRGRVFAPAIRRYAGVDATETTLSFRDVTREREDERRRAEVLLAERAARAQAEEASRAKDDFLAVVSHELRTPLSAILGWTQLLRSGSLDEARRARALETIERNAGVQQKLIEDILDVSRIVSGKMVIECTHVDVGQAVRTSVETIRPAVQAKGLELLVDLGDDVPMVVGDANRLQQIALNLLNNAVKFTPRGGSIAVTVGIEGTSACIRVRDTGQGIGPQLLPHIFDRFRQGDTGTSRPHTGLGLGLSIVRHLVELHRGSVEAESAGPGQGTTFTVRVPLSPAHPAVGGQIAALAPSPAADVALKQSLAGVRILVVDDDEDARELLGVLFQQRAAQACAVSSVAEAFRTLPAFRPQIVVSDIGMPMEDGYALIRRLRGLAPDEGGTIPAIALTAFAAPWDGERATAAGFSAFLAKPVDSARLLAMVARLVASPGAPLSGAALS